MAITPDRLAAAASAEAAALTCGDCPADGPRRRCETAAAEIHTIATAFPEAAASSDRLLRQTADGVLDADARAEAEWITGAAHLASRTLTAHLATIVACAPECLTQLRAVTRLRAQLNTITRQMIVILDAQQ